MIMNFDQLIKFVRSSDFAGKVCADSRKVAPGDIFVAVVGTHVDGHAYIPQVIEKGAGWVVSQRNFDEHSDKLIIVDDTSLALGLLAQAAAGNPAQNLTNLAVTGTNGKTTVTFITRSIIEAASHKCGLIGTIIYDSASTDTAIAAPLTTPDAITIANLMSSMLAAAATHMVTEASSHALSQNRLAGINFAAAAFTNLTGDHLDYHKTTEQYLAEKTKLFTGLSPDAFAILNKQSPQAHTIADKTNANVLWYAVNESADISAKVISMNASQTCYQLTYNDITRIVTTPMIGTHNISNQLAAAGLCLAVGIDLDTVANGIENIPSVPGRLDPVTAGQNYAVLVDYAHTDDALKNVLTTLRPLCQNRLIVLFGCGGDRDKTKRPRMASIAEEYADIIIVTSDNPRTENPAAIIDDILQGFTDPNRDTIVVAPDRKKAIEHALTLAQKDDIILLAGKGHETYQIIGTERFDFNDKQIAIDIITAKYD